MVRQGQEDLDISTRTSQWLPESANPRHRTRALGVRLSQGLLAAMRPAYERLYAS